MSHVAFRNLGQQCLLTQNTSLRQYIGAGIPMFVSFVHSFISLSPSLNYLCLSLYPSPSTAPSPSSSPFLSLSILQQTKIIQKGEAQRTIRRAPPIGLAYQFCSTWWKQKLRRHKNSFTSEYRSPRSGPVLNTVCHLITSLVYNYRIPFKPLWFRCF